MKTTLEFDVKAFPNPDGTWAVRTKATAVKDGKPIRHTDPEFDENGELVPQDKRRVVFVESEVSTPDGPKEGQDVMAWALAFAKARGVKAELEEKIKPQLAHLGLIDVPASKPVSGKVDRKDL